MSDKKDKKLDFDLGFLDKDSPKSKQPARSEHSKARSEIIDPSNWDWKTIAVLGGVILVVIWSASSGGSDSTTSTNTLPPPSNIETLDDIFDTPKTESNSYIPVVERTKTANQQCKDSYGVNGYSTGEKNADGGPICDCNDGYQWNSGQTACVAVPKVKSGLEICQERNGSYATYDSASNSCGCASGYSLGATSQQCVSFVVARDQSCSSSYPGTSFLKVDQTNGKNICDCVASSYWNNDRTACYTLSAFTQSCVNSYGAGAISITENRKRVCDCGYGYDWNIQRNVCVTTASINTLCERDVGRNSRYSGTVSDGKYQCTEPY